MDGWELAMPLIMVCVLLSRSTDSPSQLLRVIHLTARSSDAAPQIVFAYGALGYHRGYRVYAVMPCAAVCNDARGISAVNVKIDVVICSGTR